MSSAFARLAVVTVVDPAAERAGHVPVPIAAAVAGAEAAGMAAAQTTAAAIQTHHP